MSAIQPISASDVHRICSGQVVVDLCAGVKELVENALDAKATRIEVRLQHFGFDSFEVIDDGTGIPKADRPSVCLKHWTSKIRTFEDLQSVTSFGFRGEALSSLCESASSLTITTRCKEDETAEKLVFDRAGKLVSTTIAARPIGTTVTVTNLFEHLPVRRKDFEKNHKKQYANLLSLMQAYAIVSCGVRISLINHQRDGKKAVAIATQGGDKMSANLATVFGHKFLEELVPVEFAFSIPFTNNQSRPSAGGGSKGTKGTQGSSQKDLIDDGNGGDDVRGSQGRVSGLGVAGEEDEEDEEAAGDEQQSSCSSGVNSGRPDLRVTIAGFVTRAGATGIGRSGTDRQFFFVNGRPADLRRFSKAVNDVWRQFEMNHKPACALDVRLPPGSFDVNLTPDKREVLIEREADIIERLKAGLLTVWEPSRYTFDVAPTASQKSGSQRQSSQSQSPMEDATDRQSSSSSSQLPSPMEDATAEETCVREIKQMGDPAVISLDHHESRQRRDEDVETDSRSGNEDGPKDIVDVKSHCRNPPAAQKISDDGAELAHDDASEVVKSVMGVIDDEGTERMAKVIEGHEDSFGDGNRRKEEETEIEDDRCQNVPGSTSSSSSLKKAKLVVIEDDVVVAAKTDDDAIAAKARAIKTTDDDHEDAADDLEVETAEKKTGEEDSGVNDDDDDDDGDHADDTSLDGKRGQRRLKRVTYQAERGLKRAKADEDEADDAHLEGKNSGGKSRFAAVKTPSLLERFGFGSSARKTTSSSSAENQQSSGRKHRQQNEEETMLLTDQRKNSKVVVSENERKRRGSESAEESLVEEFSCSGGEEDEEKSKNEKGRTTMEKNVVAVDDDDDVVSQGEVKKCNTQESSSSSAAAALSSGWNIGSASRLLQMEREWSDSTTSTNTDGNTIIMGSSRDDGSSELLSGADVGQENDAVAVERLKRVLKKSDFIEAEIVGQFNLGFIIARIRDELFILDQHASDEKYRYEMLQRSTTIDEQPLIAPLPIELTPMEQHIVRDYRDIFAANGFHFAEEAADDEDGDYGTATSRLMLTRVPYSKQTTFGVEDVRELAAILRDDPPVIGRPIPRLPKLHAMFASRACRSAIMIGDSLPPAQMAKVVGNLSALDQPWNCPHGRPTLRHLLHLPDL